MPHRRRVPLPAARPAVTAVTVVTALALPLAVLSLVATPAAHATGPTDPSVYVACGAFGSEPPQGGSCEQLPAVLTDLTNHPGSTPVTIDLLPGSYCPIQLPNLARRLTIQGVGYAAYGEGGPASGGSGTEAELTTFLNDSRCSSTYRGIEADGYQGQLTLQNFAVDGQSQGGMGYGISVTQSGTSNGLTVRDVQVEDVLGVGLHYQGDGLTLTSSALVGNSYGLDASLSNSTVAENTFADNTTTNGNGTGVSVSGYASFYNNTITGNDVGVYVQGFGNQFPAYNNIVAANAHGNCSGTVGYHGDWEYNGSGLAGHTNLEDSSCEYATHEEDSNVDDVVYDPTLGTPGAVQANGGPTVSSLPPATQAEGAGTTGSCGRGITGGGDQREYLYTTSTQCDIGSVQDGATPGADVEPSTASLDLGDVQVGSSGAAGDTIADVGSDLAGVIDVKATGPGFSVTNDMCTYVLLFHASNRSCGATVTFTPTGVGAATGSLVFDTTGGNVTVPVTANGTPAPVHTTSITAPTAGTVTFGGHRVLTTTLTDTTTHTHLAATQVSLLARPQGSASFTHLADATTSAAGVASVQVTPTRGTTYAWSYAGSNGHDAATSTSAATTVTPVVHASAQKASVAKGRADAVTGLVSPTATGQKVTLQKLASGHWTAVRTGTVGAHGFSLAVPTGKRGTLTLRVSLPASPGYLAAVSADVKVKVT